MFCVLLLGVTFKEGVHALRIKYFIVNFDEENVISSSTSQSLNQLHKHIAVVRFLFLTCKRPFLFLHLVYQSLFWGKFFTCNIIVLN